MSTADLEEWLAPGWPQPPIPYWRMFILEVLCRRYRKTIKKLQSPPKTG